MSATSTLWGTRNRVGLVGTFPPRMCGLATFTADIAAALRTSGDETVVVALVDDDDVVTSQVAYRLDRESAECAHRVAATLSREVDIVLVEHEFGIFGGEDGALLGELTGHLTVPYVLTMHTVLPKYTAGQTAALDASLAGAALVFVFSQQAAELLSAQFPDVAHRCRIVPHGAPEELFEGRDATLHDRLGLDAGTRVVSTFGLLSPGKGVENAIAAVSVLDHLADDVVLVVAGRTHPAIVKRSGETYREGLVDLAHDLGVEDRVIFEDWFHDVDEIAALLHGSDLFVTPYTGADQIVSGALSFAVAAGLPFVSTPYRYATEMAAAGCGLTVPFADPARLAGGLAGLLIDDHTRSAMADRARTVGAATSWPRVGRRISDLLSEVCADRYVSRS